MKEIDFTPNLSYARVTENQNSLLLNWLTQEHIQEWLHGDGYQNVLNDLEIFFKGSPSFYEHWIAYNHGLPFGYLITSEVRKDLPDDAELAQRCQEEGRAMTLDLFICDKRFIGRKLAVPMIQEFLIHHFSDVAEVLIDPEAANTRAIQAYQKAGFHIEGEFIAAWHPVPHYQMRLSMKELIKQKLIS